MSLKSTPITSPTVHVEDPVLSLFANSALLQVEPQLDINNDINTTTTEAYGDATAPLGFRLGNGGAGYTGLLRELANAFHAFKIRQGIAPFRIEWVANHSRHTQIALLGNVVQVALTYEPAWEDQAICEGWAERVTRAFNDRFILVGPQSDPAGVTALMNSAKCSDEAAIYLALRTIAAHARRTGNVVTHYRGDGSATSYKEMQLWGASGVDLAESSTWRKRVPLAPYHALVQADRESVYIITDRSTFLTVKRDGAARNMRVFVEKGSQLLNPCSALINLKASNDARWLLATEFARWVGGDEAQAIIAEYGRKSPAGLPVFAPKSNDEVAKQWGLVRAKL